MINKPNTYNSKRWVDSIIIGNNNRHVRWTPSRVLWQRLNLSIQHPTKSINNIFLLFRFRSYLLPIFSDVYTLWSRVLIEPKRDELHHPLIRYHLINSEQKNNKVLNITTSIRFYRDNIMLALISPQASTPFSSFGPTEHISILSYFISITWFGH